MAKTTPEENKAIIQRYYDQVVNRRDVDALPVFLEQLAAEDGGTCGNNLITEMVANPLDPGIRLVPSSAPRAEAAAEGEAVRDPDQLAALRDFTKHVLSAFPDMLVKIDSIVAEGDTVVVRWSGRGTHMGDFLGIAPTRRVVPMASVDYFTFRNGKIVGHRGYPDSARVLAKLGQLPRTPIARLLAQGTDEDEG